MRRSLSEALKEKDLEAGQPDLAGAAPGGGGGPGLPLQRGDGGNPEICGARITGVWSWRRPEVEVTDAEVEARLEEIRQQNALLKPPAEEPPGTGRRLRGP